MDPVDHPLDWWAYGGYAFVMRETGWSLPHARREVRKAIKRFGWHPIGHRGYEQLRQQILAGQVLDNDLV